MKNAITSVVLNANLPGLLKSLARIERKAQKLGQEFSVQVGAVRPLEREETVEGEVVKVAYEVVDVTMMGSTPTLNGWEFIAQIEHLPPTAESAERLNLIRAIDDVQVPVRFRDSESDCDHCQMSRRRKFTYVVRNTDNTYKQVGSTCMKDFLGGNTDPSDVLDWFSVLEEGVDLVRRAGWDEEAMGRGGRSGSKGIDIIRFLTKAAALVRMHGFLGTGRAREAYPPMIPTCTQAMNACFPSRLSHYVDSLPEDEQTAQSAVEWAKGLGEDINDYLANLKAVAMYGYVDDRKAGIAASMVPSFKREMAQRQIRALKANSKYQGEEKKRLRDVKVIVEKVFEGVSDYGTYAVHYMRDDQGNAYSWKSSGSTTLEEGKWYILDGTVQRHYLYQPKGGDGKGIETTVLGRCAAESVEDYDARKEAERQAKLQKEAEKVERAAQRKAERAAAKSKKVA